MGSLSWVSRFSKLKTYSIFFAEKILAAKSRMRSSKSSKIHSVPARRRRPARTHTTVHVLPGRSQPVLAWQLTITSLPIVSCAACSESLMVLLSILLINSPSELRANRISSGSTLSGISCQRNARVASLLIPFFMDAFSILWLVQWIQYSLAPCVDKTYIRRQVQSQPIIA